MPSPPKSTDFLRVVLLITCSLSAGCGGDPQVGTISKPKDFAGTDATLESLVGGQNLSPAAKKRLEKARQNAPKSLNPRLADPNS